MEPKLPDLPPPDVVIDTHPFGVADDAFSGEAMRSYGLQCLRMGASQSAPWEPSFDVTSAKQEALVRQFCAEIAGPRGQRGSPPDPVRLLEMARALYEAERDDLKL